MKRHLLFLSSCSLYKGSIFGPGSKSHARFVRARNGIILCIGILLLVLAAVDHVDARPVHGRKAPTPTISTSGAPSGVSTTYGTPSASSSFNVSGSNMLAGILVTPPAGFEVSTDNTNFSATVTVGAAGNIPSTPVYIRLTAAAGANTYSGNIVLSSSGASDINVAMPNSTVSPAPLTVTPNDAVKTYGQVLTGGPGSTAFTATGLKNGETIGSITVGYGTGSAGTDGVGTYSNCVTAANATGGTFDPNNYNPSYGAAQIIVQKAPLDIIANNVHKTYGQVLTGGPGSTQFTVVGLQNGETIGSVTIDYGTGSAATDGVGTYTQCVSVSQGTGGNFSGFNYSITHTSGDIIIDPAPLTIKANNVNKPFGTTITGSSGSTAFTASGLQNGETVGSVTINYGSGSAAADPQGTYTNCVTAAAATDGTFTAFNYTITYDDGDIIVGPPVPVISASGSPSPVNTVYGTASSSTVFTVTGTTMTAGILITPPTGFEVSIDGSNFAGTITLGSEGNIPPTTIYVRLAATTPVGNNYQGDIQLTSSGAQDVTVAMPVSTVTPATVTVVADNKTKVYGDPNPVLTVTYVGFVNGDGPAQLTTPPDISTTAFTYSPVGQYPITASGAAAPNYVFEYTPGVLTIIPSIQSLAIPNAFTPNGDGINDTWNIQYLDLFRNCSVEIFNRYGKNVFLSNGYGIAWDGTSHGAAVPVGTYYYVIDFKNGSRPLSGYVAIIR